MGKQDVKQKYNPQVLELYLDGETKKFEKERVSGQVFLQVIKFRADMQKWEKRFEKQLREEYKDKEFQPQKVKVGGEVKEISAKQVKERTIKQEKDFAMLSDFEFLTKAGDIVATSFAQGGKKQFTSDQFIEGTNADEVVEKLNFYFENAISNGEEVSEETEDFLEEEKVGETE